MKNTKRLVLASALILSVGLLTTTARAASCCCDKPTPVAADSSALDLAKAKAAYPLDTCVVSGEKLEGDMGGPIDYIHKEDGKPDRLVRFCCKSCIKKFKADPTKFLKVIDDASAARK